MNRPAGSALACCVCLCLAGLGPVGCAGAPAPPDAGADDGGAPDAGPQDAGPADGGTAAGVPSRLAVFAVPPQVAASGSEPVRIVVQLLDAAGNLARTDAPPASPWVVRVTSSATDVVTYNYPSGDPNRDVPLDRVTRPNWNCVNLYATSVAGSAVITASYAGLTPGSTTVTTVPLGGAPARIKLFAAPPAVPAVAGGYGPVVQVLDAAGAPTRSRSAFDVTLASSDATVASPGASFVFPVGVNWATGAGAVTARGGTATFTATTTALGSDTATVRVEP